jgi:nucleoside-diphosphate-sugar epimerase
MWTEIIRAKLDQLLPNLVNFVPQLRRTIMQRAAWHRRGRDEGGNGDSYDIPKLIELARKQGIAPHLGSGGTLQGYVHIDELADLFRLAVERAPKSAVLHGVVDEVSQRDLAAAISRMIGAGNRTANLTLEQMFGSAGSVGISFAVNKRLSTDKTRHLTGWSPTRTDILLDVEFGSYASWNHRGEWHRGE